MSKYTNWRVPARMDIGRLDQEQKLDLFNEAFGQSGTPVHLFDESVNDGPLEARFALQHMVEDRPEMINDVMFFGFVLHAATNDSPELRAIAKQHVVALMKTRGQTEPELVTRTLNHARTIADGNKNPEFKAAAQQIIDEIEEAFPGASRPTFGKLVKDFLRPTQ